MGHQKEHANVIDLKGKYFRMTRVLRAQQPPQNVYRQLLQRRGTLKPILKQSLQSPFGVPCESRWRPAGQYGALDRRKEIVRCGNGLGMNAIFDIKPVLAAGPDSARIAQDQRQGRLRPKPRAILQYLRMPSGASG
jgi:hypothetical protein